MKLTFLSDSQTRLAFTKSCTQEACLTDSDRLMAGVDWVQDFDDVEWMRLMHRCCFSHVGPTHSGSGGQSESVELKHTRFSSY